MSYFSLFCFQQSNIIPALSSEAHGFLFCFSWLITVKSEPQTCQNGIKLNWSTGSFVCISREVFDVTGLCFQGGVSVQMFGSDVSSHFLQRATNNSERLFSHTQPLQPVNASPLTSQGRCLCTVLLCHRRLVPLGLCTLIPLSLFQEPGQCLAKAPFCASQPSPSLFQPVTVPLYTQRIPWPSSVKTCKQKGL